MQEESISSKFRSNLVVKILKNKQNLNQFKIRSGFGFIGFRAQI